MPNEYIGKHLKLWMPATYRIKVYGYLNESWSDRLAGMRITSQKRGNRTTVTTLTGRVRDQAALAGVLNSLYELHLPILSVEHLTENNERQHEPSKSFASAHERDH